MSQSLLLKSMVQTSQNLMEPTELGMIVSTHMSTSTIVYFLFFFRLKVFFITDFAAEFIALGKFELYCCFYS